MSAISRRLLAIADALPLEKGMRVLEIGCGPGALAREITLRIGDGKAVGIDRSAKAVALAIAGSGDLIASGRLEFRHSSAEDFVLERGEPPFDLAVAVRVGAFDGRHPDDGIAAREALARVLKPGAALHIDGGDPLRTIAI